MPDKFPVYAWIHLPAQVIKNGAIVIRNHANVQHNARFVGG